MYYSKIIFWLLVSFFTSVWFAELITLPLICWFAVPVILLAVWLLTLKYRIICLMLFFITFGNLLFHFAELYYDPNLINPIYNKEVSGQVTTEAKKSGGNYQLKVFIPQINRKIILSTAFNYNLEYGDNISFVCLKLFGGDHFAKDRVVGRCKAMAVQITVRHQGNVIVEQVYKLKHFLLNQINQSLPEPHSSLLSGLLFGGSQNMTTAQVEKFRNAGVSHIMAVSGFNVMIVVSAVLALLGPLYLSRKRIFFVITAFLILFILITGFEASIVRAVLMAWVMVCAKTLGRYLNMRNLLMFVAFLMTVINPFVLRYDLGFQLSFVATASLMFISPWVINKFKTEKIPWNWLIIFVDDYLIPSMVAYLATLPIIYIYFGTVSWVAPLVNILISPLVPLAMTLGAILILLANIPGINIIVSGVNWVVLHLIFSIVNFFG